MGSSSSPMMTTTATAVLPFVPLIATRRSDALTARLDASAARSDASTQVVVMQTASPPSSLPTLVPQQRANAMLAAMQTESPPSPESLPTLTPQQRANAMLAAIDLRPTLEEEDRECVPPLRGLIVGKKVGQGSFKAVYEICSNVDCRQSTDVLQVIAPKLESKMADQVIQEVVNEVAAMKFIENKTLEAKAVPLLLPVKAFWQCPQRKKAFIVQAKADGTMFDLGREQARLLIPSQQQLLLPPELANKVLVYTTDQLRQAFALARELYSRYRIIHGDLKPDNVFYKQTAAAAVQVGPIKPVTFYLGDFGRSQAFRGQASRELQKTQQQLPAAPQLSKPLQPSPSQEEEAKTMILSEEPLVSRPQVGFSRNFGCPAQFEFAQLDPAVKPTLSVSPQFLVHYNVWQLELLLRATYLTLIVLNPNQMQSLVLQPFESVDQLGVKALGIPPQVRYETDNQCIKLAEKLQMHRRLMQDLKDRIALAYAQSYDPKIGNEITAEQAAFQAWKARTSTEYTKLPTWIRFMIHAGLPVAVPKANSIFLPLIR